jgi:hypothetical protein
VGRGGHAASVLHLAGIGEHASGHARGGQAALLRAADAVVGGRCSCADSCVSTQTPGERAGAQERPVARFQREEQMQECGGRVRNSAGQSAPQGAQKPAYESAAVE